MALKRHITVFIFNFADKCFFLAGKLTAAIVGLALLS